MLKQRIITALVLGSVVVLGLLWGGLLVATLMITLLCFLCGHEWLNIIGAKKLQIAGFYSLQSLGLLACYDSTVFSFWVLGFAAVAWCAALVLVCAFQRKRLHWPKNLWLNTFIGLVLIVPMWAGLFLILTQTGANGPALTLFFLVLVWSSDIFAYFSGRALGKHLLASQVSPGKTWEGAIGAFIGTAIVAYFILYFYLTTLPLWPLLGLAVFTVAVAILGDLFESMVKRIYGVKDSGRLLPGHGGFLDRIDSLTAAAPLFAGMYFLLLQGT